MVGFKEMIVSMILLSVILFAFVNFGSNLAIENKTNVSILDNDAINDSINNIRTELSGLKDDTESNKKSFFNDIPLINAFSFPIISIFGVIKIVTTGFFTDLFEIIIELIKIVFGLDDNDSASKVIFGAFTSILIIIMVLLSWRVFRAGS